MNYWKIIGLMGGIFIVTLLTRKYQQKPEYLKYPDERYDIDDFISDQDL